MFNIHSLYENRVASGMPIFLPPDNQFAHLMPWTMEFLSEIEDRDIRNLTGNAMAVPAIGEVLFFALLATTLVERELDGSPFDCSQRHGQG